MSGKFFVVALMVTSVAAISSDHTTKTGDKDMLMKQKKIYDLLMYPTQNLTDAEYFEIGRNYDIHSNMDNYKDKKVVLNFLMRYKLGVLHQDALFSYGKQEHAQEMVLLYRLFHSAKDFDTFYKTASWARIYMNHYTFVYAFSTAVIYRDDCQYMHLPDIHEIWPNMFFDGEIIHDAQKTAMTRGSLDHSGNVSKTSSTKFKHEDYNLYYNFTDTWMMESSKMMEKKMAYFMDDVSINSYYYYVRMIFPYWIDTNEYNVSKTVRGELYYYLHQQIWARYMLERMSNGLGEMTDSWNHISGFHSNLIYANGVAMPKRDWWNVIPYYKEKYYEWLKKVEIRIMDAIDSGFVIDEMGKQISLKTPEGLNILGNLIEGNDESINYKYYGAWGSTSRLVLGKNIDSHNKNHYVPSSLEHFTTSMKDPAFYKIIKKIVDMIHRHKSYMSRYTMKDLELHGVKIEDVEVDKLITFWDAKPYLLNNAVNVPSMKDGRSFKIKAWQHHLNYKPFTYKMSIHSNKSTKAGVRIFLGPAVEEEKYDYYSYLLHYHQYFFMLDRFEVELKKGMNKINRHSNESIIFKKDSNATHMFFNKVFKSIRSDKQMEFEDRMWGFPEHMMLPKGSAEGMRYKLFVYVGHWEDEKVLELPVFGKYVWHTQSFGFPLDRPMEPWMLQLDNVYFKDVHIYNMMDKEAMKQHDMNHHDMNHHDIDHHDKDHSWMMLRDPEMIKEIKHAVENMKDMHKMEYWNMMHI